MNEHIRQKVGVALADKGMSRADLARAMRKTPQEITRALNGKNKGGSVPPIWEAILSTLQLELTVQPSSGEPHLSPSKEPITAKRD